MYDTIEEAMMGLQTMEMDVAADHGEEMVEQAHGDIVHACADLITNPEVRAEFLRRTGHEEWPR